jgi:DNA polymerase-3 subunit gamma/tau
VTTTTPGQEKEVPFQKTVKENSRPKTTINLGNILKSQVKIEVVNETSVSQKQDEPIVESNVMQAWRDFTELRKQQQAEYHLLNQPYTLKGNVIILQLTNPIEEPILQAIKADLVSFLRERINNSTLQVEGEMQQNNTKRKAYTNKEKFDYLAEKNPLLKQLQEKLGLDPDY